MPYSKSVGPFKRTVNQVSIGIGDYFASSQDVVIHTVLGSCVAVCLYDPGKKIGGMNHILMPFNPDINNYDASARVITSYSIHYTKLYEIGNVHKIF